MTDRLAEIQRAIDGFQMEEARALVAEELVENPSAAAFYLASQAALTHGDRVAYLRKALEIDPNYQVALDELAEIFPAKADMREPAIEARQEPMQKVEQRSAEKAKLDPFEATEDEPRETPVEAEIKSGPETRLASIGRRWLAIVIDGFIVAAATVLLLLAGGAMAPLEAAMVSADEAAISDAFSQFQSNTLVVNLLVSGVYNVVLMVSFNGQTLGKMMLRLRVVKKRGGRITVLDALLRNVFGYMVSQIFLLGYLWALFDREKQAWHDKMAGTVVVEERRVTR